jgi:hypothetical protein
MLNALLVAASIAASDACALTKQERKRLIKEANRLRRANKTPKHVRAWRLLSRLRVPCDSLPICASVKVRGRKPRSTQKRKVKQGAKKANK